eukprot:TRINITY_DN7568_c0_g1_i1.p1 TRINITY_DN7568_c0_g1~~TRINITY_DN7568_c0_g1_i1.p1  ORF type:complete len:615 (-),score=95.36 TRINITY_DN7568_c0_g1_i1:244-1902(-)
MAAHTKKHHRLTNAGHLFYDGLSAQGLAVHSLSFTHIARKQVEAAIFATAQAPQPPVRTSVGAPLWIPSPPIANPNGIIPVAFLSVLQYQGGPIMWQGANVYIIWYGSWLAQSQSPIRTFLASLGPSNPGPPPSGSTGNATVRGWYNIIRAYHDNQGHYIPADVSLKGEVVDSYSMGRSTMLTDDNARQIVDKWTSGGQLPLDGNGVYLVLTSSDVKMQGFCTEFCGYHTYNYFGPQGTVLQYAFIGNPSTQCPVGCATQYQQSSWRPPNGDAGVDSMISTIAHELVETVTDPLINAWEVNNGYENGDICAWQFGSVVFSPGAQGVVFNVVGTGGQPFLIQLNYDITKQACVLQAATPPSPPALQLPPPPILPPPSLMPPSSSTANPPPPVSPPPKLFSPPVLPSPKPALPPSPHVPPPPPPSVGTYITLYQNKKFKGSSVTFEAPIPGDACINLKKPLWSHSSVKSLIIDWNKKDGKKNHLGCGRAIFWDTLACQGGGIYWELPGGWATWNPNNYNYPQYNIWSVAAAAGSKWTSKMKSMSCDSFIVHYNN